LKYLFFDLIVSAHLLPVLIYLKIGCHFYVGPAADRCVLPSRWGSFRVSRISLVRMSPALDV